MTVRPGTGELPDSRVLAAPQDGHMSATEIHISLQELWAERALASIEGLRGDCAQMTELDDEIEATQYAYIAAAVTEIATLRAELSGPQIG